MNAALLALCLALLAPVALAADRLHNIVDDAWAGPQGHRFSGRLTEVRAVADANNKLDTLYRNTRLLFTSGEEGRVRWSVGGLRWQSRADDHGYWELWASQPLGNSTLTPGWHDITSEPAASGPAGLLVHDPRNRFGLISDIDDTVLVSQVTSKRRLLRNSLTRAPEQRAAVPGMATLYRSLLVRNPHPEATPVFYLSASPRQLSDSIRRFLRHNSFPRGVLQLKEVNIEGGDSLTDQQAYKVGRIAAIFEAFPEVKFMLIGDDGERDPESFAELQKRYPQSVESVWIRRVHPDPKRARFDGQGDPATLLAPR